MNLKFGSLTTDRKTARIILAVFFICAASLCLGQPVFEQEIRDCSVLNDEKVRLSCYDLLAKRLVTIEKENIGFKNGAKGTESSSYEPLKKQVVTEKSGLGEKYLKKPEEQKQDPEAFEFELISMKKNTRGTWEFRLKNGQVWQQLEAKYMSRPKQYPALVQISSGSFGSFKLRVLPKGKAVKVRRIK